MTRPGHCGPCEGHLHIASVDPSQASNASGSTSLAMRGVTPHTTPMATLQSMGCMRLCPHDRTCSPTVSQMSQVVDLTLSTTRATAAAAAAAAAPAAEALRWNSRNSARRRGGSRRWSRGEAAARKSTQRDKHGQQARALSRVLGASMVAPGGARVHRPHTERPHPVVLALVGAPLQRSAWPASIA